MYPGNHARLAAVDGEPVQLLGLRIEGDLRGLLLEARVEQRFYNPGQRHVEVVYTFPLPWGAVLLGVQVQLGDRQLSGHVVARREAQARYEDALAEGDAAIMLERNHDHSYSLNLGNLAPGEHCRITLRYAQTLQFEQQGLRLLIPTVLAPRFGDALAEGGMQPHQVPEHSWAVEHPFALELRLHGALAQARVASPSHPLAVAAGMSEGAPLLTLALAQQAWLDRDFVLVLDQLIEPAIAVAARDVVAPGSAALLASVCPRMAQPAYQGIQVKLLVDCSGSMGGDSIEAARRALHAIVGQLQEGDRFSLSRFGCTVRHRARGLWRVSERTRLAAWRWVADLEADMGGTEMQEALCSTFEIGAGLHSDVLLVTDGQIHGIDGVLAAARAAGQRVFVVGIGASPSEAHLRRLAEATAGVCDFVATGEAVEPAVLRMFARLRSPRMVDLQWQWPEGVQPSWAAPAPAAVFDGDTVSVLAQLPAWEQPPEGALRLLARAADGGPLQELARITWPEQWQPGMTLARMAALARIRSAETTVEQATDWAERYQLVTEHSNFLLLHERAEDEKAADMPDLQKIRQMLPAGWGAVSKEAAAAVQVRWSTHRSPVAMKNQTGGQGVAGGGLDEIVIPAFLRKQADDGGPSYVTHAASKVGAMVTSVKRLLRGGSRASEPEPTPAGEPSMTPLELSQRLHKVPKKDWPTTIAGLRAWGVDADLLDWLSEVPGWSYFQREEDDVPQDLEPWVVGLFLRAMALPEVLLAFQREGHLGNAGPELTRSYWGLGLARSASSIDCDLLKLFANSLGSISADLWPDPSCYETWGF